MFFQVLIKNSYDDEIFYDYNYILEAEDIKEATKRASDFISTFYIDGDKGILLVDHDNIAYKFSDGEVVELLEVNETTPEEFLKNKTGGIFLIE